MNKLITFLILVAVTVTTIEASCKTFYSGLCPGASNCMCTLGEACGTRSNMSVVRNAAGGCSGSCQLVATGECAGPNDCLQDQGSCSGPGPSPPGPAPPSGSYLGVDVSVSVSTSQFTCMKNSGISFAVVRAFQSTGNVDPLAVGTMKNAHAAGLRVSAYLFPCVSCGNPSGQVTAAISNLRINAVSFEILWLDIETYHWSSSLASNQAFILSMIQAGQSAGVSLGIYTSYYNWQSIVGLSWNGGSSHLIPLWYAHYDNSKSFSDFTPYGGWSKPSIKQYAGDVTICGVDVDANWYP